MSFFRLIYATVEYVQERDRQVNKFRFCWINWENENGTEQLDNLDISKTPKIPLNHISLKTMQSSIFKFGMSTDGFYKYKQNSTQLELLEWKHTHTNNKTYRNSLVTNWPLDSLLVTLLFLNEKEYCNELIQRNSWKILAKRKYAQKMTSCFVLPWMVCPNLRNFSILPTVHQLCSPIGYSLIFPSSVLVRFSSFRIPFRWFVWRAFHFRFEYVPFRWHLHHRA